LIVTSLFEPFGLAIVEAMSCGLPVITFDCPFGPAEIVTNGKDGFLIENRDQRAFVKCISDLINNPISRIQMGRAAIVASQRFLPANILPKWKQLFDKLLTC
jgi:glycosyltransferase involved in cell wall biosynthesis